MINIYIYKSISIIYTIVSIIYMYYLYLYLCSISIIYIYIYINIYIYIYIYIVIIPSHHNPSFESLFNGEVCNSTSRKNCPRALPGRPGLPHCLVTLPGIVAGILASQDDIAPGQSLHVTGHYWAKPTL